MLPARINDESLSRQLRADGVRAVTITPLTLRG